MKIFILSAVIFVSFSNMAIAQTLPSPTLSYIHCYGTVGITDSIKLNPVVGATEYLWETNAGQITSLLFNSSFSPVVVTTPSINITYIGSELYWEICVTAMNACCTSATTCYLMPSMVTFYFLQANSPLASPNSSGIYGIDFLCNPGLSSTYHWIVTGDITFNNGLQSTTTTQGILNVALNFGPNFTTGTLCAYTVNSFGLASDTICMTINAPVGIGEGISASLNFYLNDQQNQLSIEFPLTFESSNILIYDALGKKMFSRSVSSIETQANTFMVDIESYDNGIYFISSTGMRNKLSGKFILNR